MTIDFDSTRWNKVRQNWQAWWQGGLGRPLIQVFLSGQEAHRPAPALQKARGARDVFTHFVPHYDRSVSAEEIVDLWDYDLSCTMYCGDGFPYVLPNFGPGAAAAAFLGAEPINTPDSVWFKYEPTLSIKDLLLYFSASNYWFKRAVEIISCAANRWQGLVQVSTTDLGGNADILASFRGVESLIYDFYDHPEEVHRLTMEIHRAWRRLFQEFGRIQNIWNPGYSCWAGIFSEEPYAILQCDIAYMLGPDIFEKFIRPELALSASKLARSFYHLDGPGQLIHLDSILSIEDISGIQWIPGAGQPDNSNWPEVYRKISDSGKKIQIFDFQYAEPFKLLDIIADQIGRTDNILYVIYADISREAEIEKILSRYSFTEASA